MLVDSSVWIDHFRRSDTALADLLERGEVECHPFIIGELACGNLRRRSEILALMRELPAVAVVDDDEALAFLDSHRLIGTRLGWIDIHLLASAQLNNTFLWTLDRRLASVAHRLGLAR